MTCMSVRSRITRYRRQPAGPRGQRRRPAGAGTSCLAAMVGLMVDDMHERAPKRISPGLPGQVDVGEGPGDGGIVDAGQIMPDALLDFTPACRDRRNVNEVVGRRKGPGRVAAPPL